MGKVDIGKRLRMMREIVGLSQRRVAKLLPVAPSTLSQWESGARNPSVDDMEKLATIYGCSVTDFLGSTATQEPVEEEDELRELGKGDPSEDIVRTLAEAVKMQVENDRRRIDNDRLRIEKVESLVQDNIRRLLDRLDRLEGQLSEKTRGEEDAEAAGTVG